METLNRKEQQKAQRIDYPMSRRLLTLQEGAVYLGRSPWSMRNLIWKGLVPIVREPGGNKQWIDIRDLDNFIERNKETYI